MGYDLHITRRSDWTDTDGPSITKSEWQRIIAGDADAEAFYWFDGEISVKNPDPKLIARMIRLAASLGAQVQGDDGEVYGEDGSSVESSPPAPTSVRPGIFKRIGVWWSSRSIDTGPKFKAGQRVKNPWGVKGTVLKVDRRANGGLGSVYIRLDNGSEHHFAYKASGLEIIDPEDKGK